MKRRTSVACLVIGIFLLIVLLFVRNLSLSLAPGLYEGIKYFIYVVGVGFVFSAFLLPLTRRWSRPLLVVSASLATISAVCGFIYLASRQGEPIIFSVGVLAYPATGLAIASLVTLSLRNPSA